VQVHLKIDGLVYELYDITDKERTMIEADGVDGIAKA
jgi:hypothetical protein